MFFLNLQSKVAFQKLQESFFFKYFVTFSISIGLSIFSDNFIFHSELFCFCLFVFSSQTCIFPTLSIGWEISCSGISHTSYPWSSQDTEFKPCGRFLLSYPLFHSPKSPKWPQVTETANWPLSPGVLFLDQSIKNSVCLLILGCSRLATEIFCGNLRLFQPVLQCSLWFCGITMSYKIHLLLNIATGFCCKTEK